jgi:hypothetical protein
MAFACVSTSYDIRATLASYEWNKDINATNGSHNHAKVICVSAIRINEHIWTTQHIQNVSYKWRVVVCTILAVYKGFVLHTTTLHLYDTYWVGCVIHFCSFILVALTQITLGRMCAPFVTYISLFSATTPPPNPTTPPPIASCLVLVCLVLS